MYRQQVQIAVLVFHVGCRHRIAADAVPCVFQGTDLIIECPGPEVRHFPAMPEGVGGKACLKRLPIEPRQLNIR